MQERTALEVAVGQTVATALGREHRRDPVMAGSGGPGGNARLTAWTGLVLLVLFLAELVTLLDVHGLISWHLALGVLLVPPSLLKTASTGWRIVRYYTGSAPYRSAGPPPLLLRLLGPIVVLTTLALLGTGLALVLVGATRSREPLVTVLGFGIGVLTLHQAAFIAWAVATGLHVLGRALPAWLLVQRPRRAVPGRLWRGLVLCLAGVLAAASATWVLANPGGWSDQRAFGPEHGQPGPPFRDEG